MFGMVKRDNFLFLLHRGLFYHLSKLEVLGLNGNKLFSIHQNAFISTRAMNFLELSQNDLDFVEGGSTSSDSSCFQSIVNFIEVLTPNSNPKYSYSGLNPGNDTNEAGNPVISRKLETVDANSKPIMINLSMNNITRFTTNQIMRLKLAQKCNERGDRISEWIIDVNYNPFICNCGVSELIDYVRNISKLESKSYLLANLGEFLFYTNHLECYSPSENGVDNNSVGSIDLQYQQCKLADSKRPAGDDSH